MKAVRLVEAHGSNEKWPGGITAVWTYEGRL
jgi:hypothetical protein